MAKTVYVDFHANYEGVLPEGVTLGDVLSVARAAEICLYFATHLADTVDYQVKSGRVTHFEVAFHHHTELGDEFGAALMCWAKGLPEIGLGVHLSDQDVGHQIPIFRSHLAASLPHVMGLLEESDHLGFSVVPQVVIKGVPTNLWQADGWRDRSVAVNNGVLLNGKSLTSLQLRGVNTPVNKLDIPKWIKNYLAFGGWIYVGDVLSRGEMEPILLEPSDGRDGMDPAPWKHALSLFGLFDEDKLTGWTRPGTL